MNNMTSQETLKKMTIFKFCQILENKIQDEIIETYPANWDEDYITRRLLVAMREMANSQVNHLNYFNNIIILPFKQKGINETKTGDIAIVLDITYKDGKNLRGVAFLEAKRWYNEDSKYKAIKFDQLQTIYNNAPSAKLLLYNYNYMKNLTPTGDDTKNNGSGILPKIPSTASSIMPINLAIHLNSKKADIEIHSIPFSYQFTFRYLFGHDMEFDEKLIEAALGNIENHNLLPKYIVGITVQPGNKADKYSDVVNKVNVNKAIYAEITDPSKFNK